MKKIVILDFKNSVVIVKKISEQNSKNIEKYLTEELDYSLNEIEFMISDNLNIDIEL